ncbi:dihydrolipoyl dehydrogenase [Bacillus safensis]|uniref:Dihydrolipoyl dehydrogenase n=1 Tax=Bacillus safensis TaxID=561879 RepID=A0A5S9MDC9_BACIA|nr:dihydrolipoyl dehydrogenase [Bacillus safensis]
MATEYDLVILGGGTGGYVAAIRASQLGLKNSSCRKKKSSAEHVFIKAASRLKRCSEVQKFIKPSNAQLILVLRQEALPCNLPMCRKEKTEIVEKLAGGVKHLMKQGKIDVYEGIGRILGPSIFSPMPGTVSVEMANGEENEMLIPKQVIIATGSRPRVLPGLEADGTHILTSDDALELPELPQSMLIVGGGVIGIEWASMLNDFGVNVTVLEFADRILPTEDHDISKEMEKLLSKKGITFVTNAKVLPDSVEKQENLVTIQAEKDGDIQTFEAEKLLLSVGRVPNIEGIGLENTDIQTEKQGIVVNEHYQTKESHIYAIGDVIGGLQLAHVASHEGMIAVEHMAGKDPKPLDETLVSKCVYSHPETASVGLTEQTAKSRGFEVKIGKFPFMAIGKALVYGGV